MRNTKHGHNDISKVIGKVVPVQALGKLAGLSGAGGKGEGIANGQHREMDIDFGSVNGFTTVVRVHLLCGQTLVIEVRTIVDVNTVELTSDGLERSRATGTGRSKNDKHLTSVHNTVKVAQDINALSASASDSADNVLEA
jgi:hypothetical protein